MKHVITLVMALLCCFLTARAQPSYPLNAGKSPLMISYLYPSRILWKSHTDDKYIKGEENLLKENSGQAVLGNFDVCTMQSTGNEYPSILLDFGREIQGGIEVITGNMGNQKPVKIRVRFGESASEAMSTVGEDGATNDHALRDFETQLPWLGAAQVGNTGFRFVRIDLQDTNRNVIIKEVRAVFKYRDVPYTGSFRCSDDRLNEIWQTGAYTVHLNMQDYLWDGIKRDRLVWVGDLHPEVMTIASVFGDNEVVNKSLDISKESNPLPHWMNGISSYSMWWIIIQHDWYKFQGNLPYLQAQKDYLLPLLKRLMTFVDEKGNEKLDGNRFLDWPSSTNTQGINAGLHALLLITFEVGEQLCAVLGETTVANECKAMAQRMKKVIPAHNNSKQAIALQSLANLIPADKAASLLMKDGVKDFSTFYGYYMLQAMAKGGKYSEAIDFIKEYWGAMLDLGATTFWEDFNIDWTKNAGRIDELPVAGKVDVHKTYGDYCYKGYRHSLCHGWASGPTAWLTEHVLGINVMAPGAKTIYIEPNLGNLQWAEGSFPTPLGTIYVKHEKMPDGTVRTTIDKPEGITVYNE